MKTDSNRLTSRAGAIILAATFILVNGCDALLDHPDLVHSCDQNPDRADTFVLDWTGGGRYLYFEELEPMSLSEFAVESGGTLADIDGFRGMVRDEVEAILRDAGIDCVVVEGESELMLGENIVYISSSRGMGKTVGLGDYDPCNCRHGDFSAMFAGRWVDRSGSVAGWINAIAGVCAHEIGHNVGLNHVADDDVPDGAEYMELMLTSKSWEERQLEQRVLVEQDNCPDGEANSEPSVKE